MHRGDKVLRRNGSGVSYTLGVILAVFGRRDGSIWCCGETDEGELFHGEITQFSLIQAKDTGPKVIQPLVSSPTRLNTHD